MSSTYKDTIEYYQVLGSYQDQKQFMQAVAQCVPLKELMKEYRAHEVAEYVAILMQEALEPILVTALGRRE
jgi:hypothetical protein